MDKEDTERKEGEPQERNFMELVRKKWREGKCVSVGLDPVYDRLPHIIRNHHPDPAAAILRFNQEVAKATGDIVASYKLNAAFYGAVPGGLEALRETIAYIRRRFPDVPIIVDAKRGDIGNSNKAYVGEVFNHMNADATTIHPFLGQEANQPFLDQTEKGVFVLCRTSNPGAGEFQDLPVNYPPLGNVPFYLVVAHRVATGWNENDNCGLVVGATYPEELAQIRAIAPDLPILIPGIGPQGGSIESAVKAGKNEELGIIINSSRGIIFASDGPDFGQAAREKTQRLTDQIRQSL